MCDVSDRCKTLSNELLEGNHECSVCVQKITRTSAIWSCTGCFGILHLSCIANWARTQEERRAQQLAGAPSAEVAQMKGQVSCPLCQKLVPVASTKTFTCFCGKTPKPQFDGLLVPGSCGKQCGRRHADPNCTHACPLMCHPGPCVPCHFTREQSCFCGGEKKVVGCSSEIYGYECGNVCHRLLDCGNHHCGALCHDGPCAVCTVLVDEVCFCGKLMHKRGCGDAKGFRCHNRCTKKRNCGNHECGMMCHDGPCEICLRTPKRQLYCPCGKMPVTIQRESCLDPIPSCGYQCERPLICGHLCSFTCHDDEYCAPCKETVTESCGCKGSSYTFPCFCTYLPKEAWVEAAKQVGISPMSLPDAYPPKCHRPCRLTLSCNRHKCKEVCCTRDDHVCYGTCMKKLSCGSHTCGRLCHRGNCPPCTCVSYERLSCRCGRTWLDPPVPCGAQPPKCTHPCSIPRSCGHDSLHFCHVDGDCPSCMVLVEKRCASHNVVLPMHKPCSMTAISCGKRCDKALKCCGTTCSNTCHGGPCTHVCKKVYPSFKEALTRKS